jgi:hypothetical protein
VVGCASSFDKLRMRRFDKLRMRPFGKLGMRRFDVPFIIMPPG